MARAARFEICRGADGWWARFRAANGRVVFVSEVYARRRAAVRAILLISKECHTGTTPWPLAVMVQTHGAVEIREVDER